MDLLKVYNEMGESYNAPLNNGLSTPYDLTLDGFLLINLSAFQESIRLFDSVIDLDDKYIYAWVGKCISLFKIDKISDAINCFNRVIELDKMFEIINKLKSLIGFKI